MMADISPSKELLIDTGIYHNFFSLSSKSMHPICRALNWNVPQSLSVSYFYWVGAFSNRIFLAKEVSVACKIT